MHNPTAHDVLLYDGEELLGAKQNRILDISVLVPAGSTLLIPVSCVEQGRWNAVSATFSPAPHASHPELRSRKARRMATAPARARGAAQAEVWSRRRQGHADGGDVTVAGERRHVPDQGRGYRHPGGTFPAAARPVRSRPDSRGAGSVVGRFVEAALTAPAQTRPGVGRGQQLRLVADGDGVLVTGLALDGEVLLLSAYGAAPVLGAPHGRVSHPNRRRV